MAVHCEKLNHSKENSSSSLMKMVQGVQKKNDDYTFNYIKYVGDFMFYKI